MSDPPDKNASPRPCPVCAKPRAAAYKPFCSKRCADVDLHRWLGGTYAIPAESQDIGDLDEKAPTMPDR